VVSLSQIFLFHFGVRKQVIAIIGVWT
jgi:hypothetical protein